MSKRMPQIVCQTLLASLLGVAFLQGSGCSNNATTAEVSGSVIVDGEPAEMGAIGFVPTDGKSPTAGGGIKNGRYTAQVPFGESKVEIRVSKVIGQKKLYDTPDSKTQPIMAEVLPEKYNDQTELRIDVQPGINEKDFDLESK
ncbi:MAG: hypothetical protein ABGX16_23330 [Pirellulales bacterium]